MRSSGRKGPGAFRRTDKKTERREVPARYNGSARIIVSRTDAEAATLLDGNGDERDQPFILGATKLNIPSYKTLTLRSLKGSTTRE